MIFGFTQSPSDIIKNQLQGLIGNDVYWDINSDIKIIEIKGEYSTLFYCEDELNLEEHNDIIILNEIQFIVSEMYKKYSKVNKGGKYKNVCVSVKEIINIEYDMKDWCTMTRFEIYINLQ
jgi:hypothetical protein